MNAIFYWLLDQLIAFLANLNPARAAKVEEIRAKAEALDAEREKFLAEIEASQAELVRLSGELAESGRKRVELENANLHAKAELAARIADRARLSDADKVELEL